MGRDVAWREEMMGIIFGGSVGSVGVGDQKNKLGTEDKGRSGGEAEWGVESWKFKSSRNF